MQDSAAPAIGPGTFGTTRVRAFDGLRGLAVAAVVLFHAQIPGARGGFLGVSAFFTLSGYLITSLLLAEFARSERVSLRGFWTRRARRLLPAAFVVLAGVLLYGATVAAADEVRALRGDVLGALAYVANWRFYFSGQSYEHLFSSPSPVLHFWSLAIEEQFYIVFPLLVVAVLWLARGRRAVLGVVVAAGVVASVTASVVLSGSAGQSRVYYGTDTRAAELLIGALLAIVLSGRGAPRPRSTRRDRTLATLAGGAAIAVLAFWWATVDQRAGWLYHGGFALHAALVAVVIAAARVDGPLSRTLAVRPLAVLGALSYGIYLFHWPIFLWLSPERTGLSTAPLLVVRVALTLVLAVASYRLLEQPVLRGDRLRGRWPRIVAPAAVAALVAALLTVTWSPPPSPIVLTALAATAPIGAAAPSPPPTAPTRPTTTTTPAARAAPLFRRAADPPRPLRVLVVGDSVGVTFGRGVELWARNNGNAVVENAARIYCPLGRDLPIREGVVSVDSPRACNWTEPWQSLVRTFDPDVTLVLFSIWEGAPRRVGSSEWQQPGAPALDAWQLAEYKAAAGTLSARGGHVVWMTVPCDKDVAINKKSGLWYVNRRTIPRLSDASSRVHVLDLDAKVCPGGKFTAEIDGVHDARPDGTHFSDAGALAVANWAMPIVRGQAPAPAYPREGEQ